MSLNLPFNLRDEIAKLRKLELIALKADNAVLRQRLKIFPPLEAEVSKALSVMEQFKDRLIVEAINNHGTKSHAAESLGIGRSTLYKRMQRINGAKKLLPLLGLMWLTACSVQSRNSTCPRPALLPELPVQVSAPIVPSPATASVTVAWDASPDSTVTGYKFYYGDQVRIYTNYVDVGTNTIITLPDLIQGSTYHFAATAYNGVWLESVFSDELVYTIPVGIRYLIITEAAKALSGPWLSFRTNTVISTNEVGFFRQQIQIQ